MWSGSSENTPPTDRLTYLRRSLDRTAACHGRQCSLPATFLVPGVDRGVASKSLQRHGASSRGASELPIRPSYAANGMVLSETPAEVTWRGVSLA